MLPSSEPSSPPAAGGADAYAARLLSGLDAALGEGRVAPAPGPAGDGAAGGHAGWAASGAMALSGRPDGPPLLPPADSPAAMSGALAAFVALAAAGAERGLDGDALGALDAPALLGERAALLGLARRGSTSAGGRCRLLRASDGYVAINLAREGDRDLLLLSLAVAGEPASEEETWALVERSVRERTGAAVSAGARTARRAGRGAPERRG